MSSLLYAELAATCNALGYHDGQKYYVDTHCVETIKDLIRYLRRDDENHEIRRHLGEAKMLQMDLIPIFKGYWERSDLFDVVLRLMLNLTNPALLLYREELPADKTSRNFYLQIISHLQMYKEAMSDTAVWAIFSKKLGEILQIEWQERGEETSLVVERILILVRNVLQVPADPDAEKRTDNDASIHDQFAMCGAVPLSPADTYYLQILWALHQSGMVDIFLYISSMENEHQYYMHILEVSWCYLGQTATLPVPRALPGHSGLTSASLHSRFGGTFVLKAMKSISDQDLIYHKPLNNIEDLNFDVEKNKQKRPKNRLPMKSERTERRSAYSVRLFLKEFCVEFLTGAYNNLMHSVKELLMTLTAMDKSTDASVRNSSKVIKSNIFYVIEYRELILMLLLNFDEVKMSRAYLKDLMETAHIFLKLLEQFCSRSHLVVQKPAARRKKKKTNKDSNQNPQETLPKRDPEALWDELGPQLSVVLQGHTEISSDVIPFDAVSDKDIDEQKEVWPENDCFGNPYMSAEEEFMSIREIFMADIPQYQLDING
uniref:Timeless N-terminal domain-containing protein n=1 Tax=Timema bartmani TaxID=61472 RepID=A0A7R9F6A6_9NEOP|nr:unnamed protein product [Timema bartmani]